MKFPTNIPTMEEIQEHVKTINSIAEESTKLYVQFRDSKSDELIPGELYDLIFNPLDYMAHQSNPASKKDSKEKYFLYVGNSSKNTCDFYCNKKIHKYHFDAFRAKRVT